jgi:hypothetical protein
LKKNKEKKNKEKKMDPVEELVVAVPSSEDREKKTKAKKMKHRSSSAEVDDGDSAAAKVSKKSHAKQPRETADPDPGPPAADAAPQTSPNRLTESNGSFSSLRDIGVAFRPGSLHRSSSGVVLVASNDFGMEEDGNDIDDDDHGSGNGRGSGMDRGNAENGGGRDGDSRFLLGPQHSASVSMPQLSLSDTSLPQAGSLPAGVDKIITARTRSKMRAENVRQMACRLMRDRSLENQMALLYSYAALLPTTDLLGLWLTTFRDEIEREKRHLAEGRPVTADPAPLRLVRFLSLWMTEFSDSIADPAEFRESVKAVAQYRSVTIETYERVRDIHTALVRSRAEGATATTATTATTTAAAAAAKPQLSAQSSAAGISKSASSLPTLRSFRAGGDGGGGDVADSMAPLSRLPSAASSTQLGAPQASHSRSLSSMNSDMNSGLNSAGVIFSSGVRSFVFSADNGEARRVAQALTVISYELYKTLSAKDFVGQAWKKDSDSSNGVVRLIDRYNEISNWVATLVLIADSERKRVHAIKFFISVADELFRMQNFEVSSSVIGGLQAAPVDRLRATWSSVSASRMQRYEALRTVFSGKNNWRAYREVLAAASAPAVPLICVCLKDIVAMYEGNEMFVGDSLINVDLLVMFGKVLSDTLRFRRDPYVFLDLSEQMVRRPSRAGRHRRRGRAVRVVRRGRTVQARYRPGRRRRAPQSCRIAHHGLGWRQVHAHCVPAHGDGSGRPPWAHRARPRRPRARPPREHGWP